MKNLRTIILSAMVAGVQCFPEHLREQTVKMKRTIIISANTIMTASGRVIPSDMIRITDATFVMTIVAIIISRRFDRISPKRCAQCTKRSKRKSQGVAWGSSGARKDRAELRHDIRNGAGKEEIRKDRQEIRDDFKEIHKDRTELRQDQARLDAAHRELKIDLRKR